MRSAVELLTSRRFSISLLTVICIASVIGAVLKPVALYKNQVRTSKARMAHKPKIGPGSKIHMAAAPHSGTA